jgi:hypothetical protein
VADILLERYEKESGCPPVAVLRVELPAQLSSDLSTAVAAVQSFRAESQSQMRKVAEAMSMLVAGQASATDDPAVILPHAEKWREEWDARLESFFPANQYGRVSLTFYLLAGMPLPVLIGRAPDAQASRVVNGLLAVCG